MDERTHRYEQLDALRAFAVLAVVACHTLDRGRDGWAAYGAKGVTLFFVISGFLITGILIDARGAAAAKEQPIRRVVGSFYARRVLRIFPIYYLTLIAAALIGIEGIPETLGWNLAYLSNWQIALDGRWGEITHLWSLAVEEQFYLLWPFVVLLAPRRWVPWAIGSVIAMAVMTRIVLVSTTDMWSEGAALLTPSALDALGLGALLAVLWRSARSLAQINRIVLGMGLAGLALILTDQAIERVLPSDSSWRSLTSLGWPLLFVWVVHQFSRGVGGRVGRLLTLRPIVYVGIISYGIYLLHLFVVPTSSIIERKTGLDLPIPTTRGFAQFIAVALVSIAAASLTWTLIERPINDRKRHFPYVQTGTSVSTPASTTPATVLSRAEA